MADAGTVSGGRFWGGRVYEKLYRGRVEPVSVHRSLRVADPVRRLPRLKEDKVPEGLRGTGITLVICGIIALGFVGFSGMIKC